MMKEIAEGSKTTQEYVLLRKQLPLTLSCLESQSKKKQTCKERSESTTTGQSVIIVHASIYPPKRIIASGVSGVRVRHLCSA